MSNYYTSLIEKIEKQNSYSLKDKMEVQYQLREISQKLQTLLTRTSYFFRIIMVLQIMSIGVSNFETLLPLLRLFL